MRPLHKFLLLPIFILSTGQTVVSQEWTQWRGPTRDGLVPASVTPNSWPESFERSWRVEVGEGYSSPVLSNGRVFVHSRQDPEEVVSALNLSSGALIWRQKYGAAFQKNQYAVKMAKGPNATPLVAANRLITLGVTGILTAWNVSDGKKIWQKDFSNTVDTSKLFCGTAASPLMVGDLVVVQLGSDVHGGRLIALNPATGAIKWEWQGPGPGYASPILINAFGGSQIVTLTNSSIVGVDATSGKGLWSIAFPDEWHENIVTPLWTGTHLIVSGTRQGTHAYLLEMNKGQWQAKEAWKNADVAMYMSSPVLGDGLLYGHSAKRKGQFVALDPKSGVVAWITEGREGDHASVLLTQHNLIYLTNGADLIVAKRGAAGFAVERKYDVADAETWSTPIFLGSDLIIRDATTVSRLTANKATSANSR